MATSPQFSSILDRQSSTTERPKAIPVGTYLALVKGLPRQDVSSKKGTPFVEFSLQLLSAGEDVDEEALAAALDRKDGPSKLLGDIILRATYYTTEDNMHRLKKFLSDCGLDVDEKGVTFRQLIEQAQGCQLLVSVKHQSSEDGEAVYAQVASTAKAE